MTTKPMPPTPPTKLSKLTRPPGYYGRVDQPDESAARSRMAAFRAGAPRGEYAEIPMIGRVWVQLAAHYEVNEIESETWLAMQSLKLEAIRIHALTFEAAKAVRTLAITIRDPDDPTHATPFGTLSDWEALDVDLIAAAWHTYLDCRHRLAPLEVAELSDEDRQAILVAISKKNATALRSYGVAKLSRYLLTTEPPPSTSTTPGSSSGQSSPASST